MFWFLPNRFILKFTVLILVYSWMAPVLADEDRSKNDVQVIVTNAPMSADDHRFNYYSTVLLAVMERTSKKYGPFEIKSYPKRISRKRALYELRKGALTVFGAPTRQDWERDLLPVRIPIRKGILGYKIFLIKKENIEAFKNIKTVEALKKLRLGAGAQWSITSALEKLGFDIYGSTDYESLFMMLNKNRFDYFPRGINEVFDEFESRKELYPNMVIEQNLALYIPTPTYFFVSPKNPGLVERLTEGLQEIIKDGTLDRLFDQYYGKAIAKADLKSRRIFVLENLTLDQTVPLADRGLWLHPE